MRNRHKAGAKPRKWPSAFDLAMMCRGTGAVLGIRQQTVQCVCEYFVRARDSIRREPGFRASFGAKRALGWVPFQRQSRKIDGNTITYLGRTFHLFGIARRPIPASAKGGFFVEDQSGHWWSCIHVESEHERASSSEIGIDLGLKSFAALSNGQTIPSPQFQKQSERALATAQRAKNINRARSIVIKVKRQRNDFHHKLSTRLAREHALIAVGDINASGLAQTKMAKSVYDAGWSSFRKMLRYKASRYVEVSEDFTTQTCSSCGALPPERPKGIAGLGIREWECSSCGASHDRDVNAAKNILNRARGAPRLAEESRC